MSGSTSTGYVSTPLTDAEKVDIRRFCGYPMYVAGPAGFQSWRFFQAYGVLEFRLNNMAAAEYQVLRQHLAQLYPLETAIPAVTGNLDTDQAAVWYRNKNEMADRRALFGNWRRHLCAFLGVPPGPELQSSSASRVI